MTRVVRIACAVLFLGTTLCSLVLSASSTLTKAELVHVPGGALWSAVGVLELVSLAGTLRWLTASTARGRAHAIVVVAAVATVTSFAGWAAYGWLGLVAPIAVVATIHMVHETLTDLESPAEWPLAEPWGGPDAVADTVPAVVTEPDTGTDDADIDWSLSERKLAMALGITRHAARQLKAERAEASA